MLISRIGTSAAVEATTITIPSGHQIGDLLIIFAFRNALTAPSLPAGWTSLATGSSSASSYRVGWKLAISSADTSGTWTNATGLVVSVYRNTATNKTPIELKGVNSATSTTITYSATNTQLKCAGTSWVIAFAATKTIDSALETPPTGLTNMATLVGAAVEYAGHDSNAVYTGNGSWATQTVSAGGTAAEYRSTTIEIFAEQNDITNYMGIDVSTSNDNILSIGEKIY